MNRGDRREPIFQDDLDRRRFVETLGEVSTKTSWHEGVTWGSDQLAGRRKEDRDREKVTIARRLRKETTMMLEWIAGRLKMGGGGLRRAMPATAVMNRLNTRNM